MKGNCFFNESVCFILASGILEDGSVAFFHMNLSVFWNRSVFLMRVFFLLASGILEDGSVAFLSYEFIYFFWKRNCFFNQSVFVFLASGILEDGSVAFFSI